MKKKLWILCVIAILLLAGASGFTLAYMSEKFTYDQIAGLANEPPAHAAHSVGVLHEGDFPGMSDTPVTAEEAAPGWATLRALRGQEYTRAFPLLKPTGNGIAIREISGCTPFYIAYWDGKRLWLPDKEDGHWRGYVPSAPKALDEALQAAYKLQREIRNKDNTNRS